jgi:hypothetical protein
MRTCALVIALLIAGTAEAGATTIDGAGSNSCGEWLADRSSFRPGSPLTAASGRALQSMQWVMGFLSGIGFLGQMDNSHADPLDAVDAQGVWTWIDAYCRANPTAAIARASAAFYYAHPHK